MYTIENDLLKIKINPTGAELSSVFNKLNELEYLWSGDVNFWGKKSPVLFPVVGTLKNNRYYYNGKSYELTRHGFAREMIFVVAEQGPGSITFNIQSNERTLRDFPFYFSFSIKYVLVENSLSVSYSIVNKGSSEMYFSVGGHPAFKVPVKEELEYEDYYLLFDKVEDAGRWPISKEGLIEPQPVVSVLNNTDRVQLSKELFYGDALVFKQLQSQQVQLRSDKDTAGLIFDFQGFPFVGIWAAKDADFVCIEPWCGIADSVDSSQDIKEKEGIITLDAGSVFERTWMVTIF